MANDGSSFIAIFVVGSDDQDAAEKAVRDEVTGTIDILECRLMPPGAALAFNVQPGEVRQLTA
ncbi:hypothetical protein [Sphingomonas sp. PP-CC-3G-468]|uniref:hypothetical protein n=2 Tax=unclassified Sphingomonas TaxID=196159 RepID=UPI000E7497CC|nr:hypothetical protein [Sphingomonas sp. PP-CC-3G-468]RKE45873.1 hypothetical protein C8J39_3012 [Sphingomonas sp. PP-CC-1A-547]TCM06822.1 hypothetical protein C8J41_104246 [Sphingomonas sp. PP-CC-3G-468]